MKKLIIYSLLVINCFATDSYDIRTLIYQKENIEINKEKYKNENYSLSKITLLNFDIERINKEIELGKNLKEFKKEKTTLEIFIENKAFMKNFYSDKVKFYNDYLKTMEKNKDKFTLVDINEAKSYLNKAIEEQKNYEKNIELNEKNYKEFYLEKFDDENLNYKKLLEEKTENYKVMLNNKLSLMEATGESKLSVELARLEGNKAFLLLEKEKKTLEMKELENNRTYQHLLFRLEIMEKNIENYELKSEKKQKELALGLITQKDYFEFFNDKLNAMLQKNEVEKEIKLMRIELGIEKGTE